MLLQDVKNLTLFLIKDKSILSNDLINFLHMPIYDRYLRTLIHYLQYYLKTWHELSEKRAGSSRRLKNPLAGGVRYNRSRELHALRLALAREYYDLLIGCQSYAKKYHHNLAGQLSYNRSMGERDLRIFEFVFQFGTKVAWISLERKHNDLIGKIFFFFFFVTR